MTEAELIKAQNDLIVAQQNFISIMSAWNKSGISVPDSVITRDAAAAQKPEEKISLSEYAQTFLKSRKSTTKESTYQKYAWDLNRHILPALGDTALCEIDNMCLQRFADENLETLSKKSVHELVGLVKNILNDAYLNGVVEPKKFAIKYPKNNKTDFRTLSDDEFQRLEEYLFSQKKPHDIGELILLETGMRIGEMCGLKWGDVDTGKRMIRIRRTVQRVYNIEEKTSKVSVGSTKTSAGEREVPISEELSVWLFERRREENVYVASGQVTPTEPRTHRQYHKRLMNRIGIDYINPHGLRHTFATRAIRRGVDPKTVSAILGHSNSNITLNIYTSVTEDMLRKGIEKMVTGR